MIGITSVRDKIWCLEVSEFGLSWTEYQSEVFKKSADLSVVGYIAQSYKKHFVAK